MPNRLAALEDQDILYVLQRSDVESVLETMREAGESPPELTDALLAQVQSYLESWAGDSAYGWADAMTDAIRDFEG